MLSKQIQITRSDITLLKVDAIINAANESLLGGGGVDGAIHKKAGPQLKEACLLLQGCKPGFAKITKGYEISAKYIIHTVGPIWDGGKQNEHKILASCYDQCFTFVDQYHLETLAFPAISCGAYGFPISLATPIAFARILHNLERYPIVKQVYMCAYTEEIYEHYMRAWEELQTN